MDWIRWPTHPVFVPICHKHPRPQHSMIVNNQSYPAATFTSAENMTVEGVSDSLKEGRELCRSNLVKQVMRNNEIATSFGLRLCLSTELPLIARRAGYSAILINLEHTAVGMETVRELSVASLNAGITPMVVVPTCESHWISRCLDAGAQCIIVPHVNNVQEAQLCVGAAKYPPLGHRSLTMVQPITQYASHLPFQVVSEVVNEAVMILPMIETQKGLANVEAIATVPGIDGLFIGCADLSMELGTPGQYDAQEFHDAIDKIATAAKAASTDSRTVFVGLGGIEPRPDLLELFAKRHSNIRLAMAGRDVAMLAAGMTKQVSSNREISDRVRLHSKGDTTCDVHANEEVPKS